MFHFLYQVFTVVLFFFALIKLFSWGGDVKTRLLNLGLAIVSVVGVGLLQMYELRVLALVQPQAPVAETTPAPEPAQLPESTP